MQINREYTEPDINAAAFLATKGYRFIGLEPSTPNRFAFCFEDPGASAGADSRAYYSRATVCAVDFASNLRLLKDRLYAQKTLTRGNRNGDHENHQFDCQCPR
jgi:hypothetical protein